MSARVYIYIYKNVNLESTVFSQVDKVESSYVTLCRSYTYINTYKCITALRVS